MRPSLTSASQRDFIQPSTVPFFTAFESQLESFGAGAHAVDFCDAIGRRWSPNGMVEEWIRKLTKHQPVPR